MVYRGKPSAGCEACRKAKKRCGLEQPACLRCVKLKKTCSGYRDTTQLQIQDETSAVMRKAERRSKGRDTSPPPPPATRPDAIDGVLTPSSLHSDSSSSSDGTVEISMTDWEGPDFVAEPRLGHGQVMGLVSASSDLLFTMKIKPDELACTHFFNQFTTDGGHWSFMRRMASNVHIDPCLELGMKACGMAALDNVHGVAMGKQYARTAYGKALSLVNEALRDPKRCTRDETLIAVSLLGYYENLTCDGRQSIQSWKAHVNGATQLLKLRGRAQFETPVGRSLFAEARGMILIHSLWANSEPPSFLLDYQEELDKFPVMSGFALPAYSAAKLTYELASIRGKIKHCRIPDVEAAQRLCELDRKFVQWSVDAVAHDKIWQFSEVEVAESPHVWNGIVHSYSQTQMALIWNNWRILRIMLTRTHELLCNRLDLSEEEHEEQMQYFRSIRRNMTDEICKAVPCCLGHANPTQTPHSVLMEAYLSIWPLFVAGTAVLERMGLGAWAVMKSGKNGRTYNTSAAVTQSAWILGRLEYISNNIGLKWAEGIAATMRGEFRIRQDVMSSEDPSGVSWGERMWDEKAPWIRRVEETHSGPFSLLHPEEHIIENGR